MRDDEPATRAFPSLLDWLSRNGVSMSPKLRIGPVQSDGPADQRNTGVFAIQSIASDEILCRIPKSTLLSRQTCSIAIQPDFLTFREAIESAHPQPDAIVLATLLMIEQSLGSESRWYAYLHSLPTNEELRLPSFWTSSIATSWLHGTDVSAWLQHNGSSLVRALTSGYNQVFQLILTSARSHESVSVAHRFLRAEAAQIPQAYGWEAPLHRIQACLLACVFSSLLRRQFPRALHGPAGRYLQPSL